MMKHTLSYIVIVLVHGRHNVQELVKCLIVLMVRLCLLLVDIDVLPHMILTNEQSVAP